MAIKLHIVVSFSWCSVLSPSLSGGNMAVEAIIDYEESLAMIRKARNLIVMANETLINSTPTDIDDIMNASLATMAKRLLGTAIQLLSEAEKLYECVNNLLQDVDEVRRVYEGAKNQTQEITNLVIMLACDVNDLARAVLTNEERVNKTLNTIQLNLKVVDLIYELITTMEPILEQNVTRSHSQLDKIEMVTGWVKLTILYNIH